MSPSGVGFEVERVLGYMFYRDNEPDDPALTSTAAETFQNDIASNLNSTANALGFTITCVGVGYERRGNRLYWFVQVTVKNHNDIENKVRQVVQRAFTITAGNFLAQFKGLAYVIPYIAPRYLLNGTEVVFDSVNFGKCFRARLWGEHGRSAGTVDTRTWVDDWLAGAGIAEFAYRVSEPLNLNISVCGWLGANIASV
jgi:hypothetical protein